VGDAGVRRRSASGDGDAWKKDEIKARGVAVKGWPSTNFHIGKKISRNLNSNPFAFRLISFSKINPESKPLVDFKPLVFKK
jgi:hypothetical protein